MNSTPLAGTPSVDTAQREAIAETRARRFWVGLIVLFLGANCTMGFTAAYIAMSDTTFRVIPNYYQEGMKWDEVKQIREASLALKWEITVDVDSKMTPTGRPLSITLNDAQGMPVTGARCKVKLFHHAHSNDIMELSLTENAPGVYQVDAPVVDAGLWQFDLDVNYQGQDWAWSKQRVLRWDAGASNS